MAKKQKTLGELAAESYAALRGHESARRKMTARGLWVDLARRGRRWVLWIGRPEVAPSFAQQASFRAAFRVPAAARESARDKDGALGIEWEWSDSDEEGDTVHHASGVADALRAT